jgi:hypothetical protein
VTIRQQIEGLARGARGGYSPGPYPGTYTESGTFTLLTRTRFDFFVAPAEAFQASFEIHSGDTVITGTKTLIGGFGDCEPALSPGNADGAEFEILTVSYDAVIHSASGDFADRGTSEVVGQDRQINSEFPERAQQFSESFQSSLAAVEPLLELRPGKGCGDKNHRHERSGECKR